MKILFVATTQYSLLNIIQAAKYNIFGENAVATLFVYKRDKTLETIDKNLLASIFEDIQFFDCLSNSSLFKKAFIISFGLPALKRELNSQQVKITSSKFDLIVTPNIFYAHILQSLSVNGHVALIEEGLSSYTGRVLDAERRSKSFYIYNLFSKFKKRRLSIKSIALYLPELFIPKGKMDLVKIPSFSNDDVDTCRPIFNISNTSLSDGEKNFLIGQPFWGNQNLLEKPNTDKIYFEDKSHEIYHSIFKYFSENSYELIFRPHPLEVLSNEFTSYQFISSDMKINWELGIASRIKEDDILINLLSTVSLTPSLLFGKEPIIIFLYKIFNLEFYNADVLVERLRSIYSNPDKIYTPKSICELQETLDLLRN